MNNRRTIEQVTFILLTQFRFKSDLMLQHKIEKATKTYIISIRTFWVILYKEVL